jgi:hypothetical protein
MNYTPAQALVERLFFNDEHGTRAEATRLISLRVPEEVLVYAEAVVRQVGSNHTSRSAMLNEWLRLGFDLFLAELPDSERAKLEGHAFDIYTADQEVEPC